MNRLAHIANFYSSKLDELQFFLEKIVDACDESLRWFKAGQENTDDTGRLVTFSFSAYTNTVQTLKDATGLLREEVFPWSKIKTLRHGSFMYDARNAITHDGNPIISGWADGRYFVPFKIVRLNNEKKVVVIDPPTVDVKQFCLEFTADFADLLSQTLKMIPDDIQHQLAVFNINELDEMFRDSSFIPEFARQLHVEQREQVLEALQSIKAPRIETAIQKADDLAAYCAAKLAETSTSST
jgi:hypothetical protein